METLIQFVGGVVALFVILALVERGKPGARLPAVRGWRLRGLAFFVVGLALSIVGPLFWDAWLGEHRLVDGTGLGTWGGALVGFLVLELGVYGWHRLMHAANPLWRHVHQLHHSAERVDIYGAFYFHPLDILGFAFVYSFVLVMVTGVSAEAALIANGLATFCSMFQHTNVRTPRWLGYIVQRPESHAYHHARGVHGYNYSDLPLWDMVFGTFRNPAGFPQATGFWDGASARVGGLLIGRDLAEPPVDAKPRVQVAA